MDAEKKIKTVKPQDVVEKVCLALTLDQYVNGEDRLAGYIVLEVECVGKIGVDDLNSWLKQGHLKAVKGNENKEK